MKSVKEPLVSKQRLHSDETNWEYSGLQRFIRNLWVQGTIVLGVILGVLYGLVVLGRIFEPQAQTYSWNFSVIWPYFGALLTGLELTIELTIVTVAVGLLLGVVVAVGRLSKMPPVRAATTVYIEVMRGTPVLIQLVWVYYALPILTGVQLPALESVLIALILNVSAFYGEAYRAGIQSIPSEQIDTAIVLGLSAFKRLRYVILPQALRMELPVLISQSISLFKDTSLVSVIGVADLMYNGQSIALSTYRPLEIFTVVAIVYFLVAFPSTLALRRLEIKLSRHRG